MEEYLAQARQAEEAAARCADDWIRRGFLMIAASYRQLARFHKRRITRGPVPQ
jgi:hypothetical protein